MVLPEIHMRQSCRARPAEQQPSACQPLSQLLLCEGGQHKGSSVHLRGVVPAHSAVSGATISFTKVGKAGDEGGAQGSNQPGQLSDCLQIDLQYEEKQLCYVLSTYKSSNQKIKVLVAALLSRSCSKQQQPSQQAAPEGRQQGPCRS